MQLSVTDLTSSNGRPCYREFAFDAKPNRPVGEAVMDYLDTIKTLYTINGIAAILLYVPQICSAWKNRSAMHSVSLITFGGWSVGSAVTVLYAWFFIKDPVFTAASFGGMVGATAMFGIVAGKRLIYREAKEPARERRSQAWCQQQLLIFED